MSTILKALRRLENQKNEQAATDELHGDVLAPDRTGQSGWVRRLLIAAGIIAGIAFMGLAVAAVVAIRSAPESEPADAEAEIVMADEEAAPATVGDAVGGPVVAAVVAPSADDVVVTPEERSAAAAALEEARLKRKQDRLMKMAERRAAKRERLAQEAALAEGAAIAAVEPKASPAPAPAPRVAEPEPEPEMFAFAPPPPRVAERAVVAPLETPNLPARTFEPLGVEPAEMMRVTLPDDLDVVRTRWHPHPNRRIAYLSLPDDQGTVEFSEGEFYGEWVIKEIQLSGVVFEYDGATIVRSVGRTN